MKSKVAIIVVIKLIVIVATALLIMTAMASEPKINGVAKERMTLNSAQHRIAGIGIRG